MKTLVQKINDELKIRFEKSGLSCDTKISVSNRPELCDYQLNQAFSLSKTCGKKPIDVAKDIKNIVSDMTIDGVKVWSKVDVCPPGFVNLSLSDDILDRETTYIVEDKNLSVSDVDDGVRCVLLDYGGANIAKPLHIGHLRVAVIGESYKRICQKVGKKTIGDVHLGDFGLPMGLVVEELKDEGIQDTFTIDDLQVVYPKANNRAKGIKNDDGTYKVEPDVDFNERAHKATNNLQNEVDPDYSIWKRVMDISIKDLKVRYKSLGVDFDYYYGESTVKDILDLMVIDFIDRKICVESNGAYVVDVRKDTDKKEMPPCIIKKTDGSVLYATTDLGTIIYREKNFDADKYVYVVDKRQSLHFEQVFRTSRLAKIVGDKKIFYHIGVGTMNGPDGKPFKSRDGGVLKLETLVGDCIDKAKKSVLANADKDIKDIDETSRMIAMAAIKYGDLQNQPTRDYVFDIDKFLSFQGNTGPYILYTVVRIKSILDKLGINDDAIDDTYKDLMLSKVYGDVPDIIHDINLFLTKYDDTVKGAYVDYSPSYICKYIYDLSDKFNTFYHEHNILNESDMDKKNYMIYLCIKVKKILLDALYLLGIECPDRM
ncbi:MAG: arginine--tRNA ligase [Lachnospiraceae bacterium]|nr:arginine--tRNA ligase [Lachnospiraceae bacterium]